MIDESDKYEEWLTAIANTRFIYNTMEELEQMLDTHSIHSNGIKRSFLTPQKLRSAFRDLMVEVDVLTDGQISLDLLMLRYHRAWTFFRKNLHRRSNPEQIALELLTYCYPPFIREGIRPMNLAIYEQVEKLEINVPFLVLMLMKAVPGYDSKGGDVIDIPRKFEQVMLLMEKLMAKSPSFSILPAITQAREEAYKSRLMLFYHVSRILNIYESYSTSENLYDTSITLKQSYINLDIEGFWNECGGKLESTNFWQIEDTCDNGTYFMTRWHKDAQNQLTAIRYSLFLIEDSDGQFVYYLLHPEAIKHRMKGLPYGDADQVWYKTECLDEHPSELPLERLMYSGVWPQSIHLTRCTNMEVLAQYDRWLHHDCQIVKPYQHLEYEFHRNLYAITRTHLYIPSENEGEYFKVPLSSYDGFDRIQMSDSVGSMVMNGQTYLVFDEFLLYIPASKKALQKYGIERVRCIE
ncbi:MAG: hypothetical protein MJZ60_01955 [Bacteroidaceae bacterium]|nr:hypothetical protein [Bacteroidaceae bacterium]